MILTRWLGGLFTFVMTGGNNLDLFDNVLDLFLRLGES